MGVVRFFRPDGSVELQDDGLPDQVPASVSARQARLALLAAGLLAEVQAAVAVAGGALAIEWEYATEIERASPMVSNIGAALGLTEAQIDVLFIDAAAR